MKFQENEKIISKLQEENRNLQEEIKSLKEQLDTVIIILIEEIIFKKFAEF